MRCGNTNDACAPAAPACFSAAFVREIWRCTRGGHNDSLYKLLGTHLAICRIESLCQALIAGITLEGGETDVLSARDCANVGGGGTTRPRFRCVSARGQWDGNAAAKMSRRVQQSQGNRCLSRNVCFHQKHENTHLSQAAVVACSC